MPLVDGPSDLLSSGNSGISMPILKCRAVLFDLDGTLIDSRVSIDVAYAAWCAEHGLDLRETLETAHGRRTQDSVRLIVPHCDPDVEVKKLEDLECATVEGLVAMLGAKELLTHLGATHWAIVTSGSRRLANHRLSHCGFLPPPVFITADDVVHGKPNPEGYKKAADGLGVSYADCIVFEDAPAGVQAARSAGMRSIAVTSTHPMEALSDADYQVFDWSKVRIEIANGAEFGAVSGSGSGSSTSAGVDAGAGGLRVILPD